MVRPPVVQRRPQPDVQVTVAHVLDHDREVLRRLLWIFARRDLQAKTQPVHRWPAFRNVSRCAESDVDARENAAQRQQSVNDCGDKMHLDWLFPSSVKM